MNAGYEETFAGLLRLCEDAKKSGADQPVQFTSGTRTKARATTRTIATADEMRADMSARS